MAIPVARLLVSSPARTPLRYGLLSTTQVVDETDVHWRLGVGIEHVTCDRSSVFTQTCPVTGGDPDVAVKTPQSPGDCRTASPFTVYHQLRCSSVGFYDGAEAETQAALVNGESRAVEREFESGEFGTWPHLAADAEELDSDGCIRQTAAVTVTGAPLALHHAISHLEHRLADCYGNEGVIHVPARVAAHALRLTLFTVDGPRLRSPAGHLVAIGAGYRGLSPAGVEPAFGSPWLYATGAITVRRSVVQVFGRREEGLSRSNNDVTVTAERDYVIIWDCCHFAAQTDLALT